MASMASHTPHFVLYPEQPRLATPSFQRITPINHVRAHSRQGSSPCLAVSHLPSATQPPITSLVQPPVPRASAMGVRCHAANLQDPATQPDDVAEPMWSLTPPPRQSNWQERLPPPPSLLPSMPQLEPEPDSEAHTDNADDAGMGLEQPGPDTPQGRLARLQAAARKDRNLSVQSVQWYPGHIARAERQLKEQLKMVDVVLEVRDARIPVATHHPQVIKWVGPKPRLLVINRQDQITPSDRRAWAQYYKSTGQKVFWTHGKQGDGVKGVRAMLDVTSAEINAKRAKRGLAPRPVRACVIGFPNIGKSALINRLLGRKAVASAPKPGVTRNLQWVRLSGELDLLDAPGVIPASFNDQVAAQRLAVCNDIGEAAYVDSAIAAAFLVRCKMLPSALHLMDVIRERYGVDPEVGTAEDFLVGVADKMFFGELENAGARILKDFRAGYLGVFALELPGDVDDKRRREVEEADGRAAKDAQENRSDRTQF